MARVLVTGGAGFIGSSVVAELLRRGDQVRVLDNFSTGRRENLVILGDHVELIEGDIRSYRHVREAVDGVDVVLHQAALPSVPRSIRDPLTTDEVNTQGTLNVLEACVDVKVRRVVVASSSSVYGNSPQLPKHEGMMPEPASPYAVSKLAAEHYCRVFATVFGLHVVVLRYFNVFGPRQDPNAPYSAVIPKFLAMMRRGERPVIYGDGEQSRDFTYVANVVEANLRAAEVDCPPGLVLNCACGERTSLNQLVRELNAVLGTKLEPVYQDRRPGEVVHSLADITLASRHLDWKPRVSLREGLQRMADAFTA